MEMAILYFELHRILITISLISEHHNGKESQNPQTWYLQLLYVVEVIEDVEPVCFCLVNFIKNCKI